MRRSTLVVGPSGARKTVLAMHFILHGSTSIGGSLTIESSPGCGTYMLAEPPLPRGGAAAGKKKRWAKQP